MLNSFIHTSASTIFLKTFQQFLDKVPVEDIVPNSLDEFEYHDCQGFSPYSIGPYSIGQADIVRFKPIKGKLLSSHGCNRMAQLKDTVNTKYLVKPNNYIQELEDRAVNDSVVNMGEPTMIVSVGNREWLLANSKDFKIFRHRHKDMSLLVCTAKCRNFIYKVAK